MATQLTLVVGKSRQAYAEEICRVWQMSVDSIIETGRLIHDAKDGLAHGEFGDMIEKDLPFEPRTAQMLMAIAQHPVISNANHGSLLPASWRTLYELTRLPEETLEAKIADGTVNPRIARQQVIALQHEISPPKPRPPKPPPKSDSDRRKEFFGARLACVLAVKQLVFDTLHEIPIAEHVDLFVELRQELNELEQQFANRAREA